MFFSMGKILFIKQIPLKKFSEFASQLSGSERIYGTKTTDNWYLLQRRPNCLRHEPAPMANTQMAKLSKEYYSYQNCLLRYSWNIKGWWIDFNWLCLTKSFIPYICGKYSLTMIRWNAISDIVYITRCITSSHCYNV